MMPEKQLFNVHDASVSKQVYMKYLGLGLHEIFGSRSMKVRFCRLLKTDLYRCGWAGGASE